MASLAAPAQPTAPAPGRVTRLHEGWTLQSGCGLRDTGAVISTAAFHPGGYRISVPATVLAGQVAAGEFKDPYFGLNLREVPGSTYPIGENFSNLPMPQDSPYQCSWWYRKEFAAPASEAGGRLWLHFGGINYRANIWLNGKQVADATKVAGAYRTYDFDVTGFAHAGQGNVLAVEVFAPTPTDLGINWVDWSPCPPDKDMGLWGDVELRSTGPVSVRSPLVATHFPDASLSEADLTVYGELQNASTEPVHGTASASLLGLHLEQAVDLAPGEEKTVVFSPEQYAQLKVQHPSVWWPYQMGTPHLESVSMEFAANGSRSDGQEARFGIREITSELTDRGYRLFRVNGKPILIRGAGWASDMLLRENPERLAQQFALVRDMHLNAIRLEGKLETEDFYRLADEQGVLVIAGWCCCDQWEHWKNWTPENFEVAQASLRAQMLRIRHHASLMVWLNGSDNPPPPKVEEAYLDIEKETHWPNPTLSSASETPTSVSGPSGVKMSGPYDFVAPSYWLIDRYYRGGAFGFNTETSPGPAIPTLESLHKFLPSGPMWPPSGAWTFHNGGEGFQRLDVFNTAMDVTYGKPVSLDDYEYKSQAMAYDGERAMFEAYGRNKYTSTGVIQWMLNNAWPSMIWHLYDYYLDAGGGYFGAKKACEPVHIQYSYDDHSIWVVNSRYQETPSLHATARVYDVHLKQLFSQEADVQIKPDSSGKVISIPEPVFHAGSQVYFVQLALRNASGDPVSENFYWVPATLTTFNWGETNYTHTPAIASEQMTTLASLPAATVTAEMAPSGEGKSVSIRLHNSSTALAFQVALRALDSAGQAVEPVFWSDNYIELMPGETRTLTATTWDGNHSGIASVGVSGWNIRGTTVHTLREKNVAQR
jgi:exo-1,4-beta-D-glucosaminidase